MKYPEDGPLSSSKKPLNISPPPIYIDHLEIASKYMDPTSTLSPRVKKLPAFAMFLHKSELSISPGHQVSVGGKDHASANGKRIYKASQNLLHPRYDKHARKKDPLHNQLTDAEKAHVAQLAANIEPWKWMLDEYLLRQLPNINAYVIGTYPSLHAFELRCRSFELYREYLLPRNRREYFKKLKRVIGSLFNEGWEVGKNDSAKYVRGESCYWQVPVPGKQGQYVFIKAYIKGNYVRIEIQAKNFSVNKNGVQSFQECNKRLTGLGNNLVAMLDQIHNAIQAPPPKVNVGALESAISHYLKNPKGSKAVDEFVNMIATYASYCRSSIKNAHLRLSDYQLKILSNPQTGILTPGKALGITPTDGQGCLTNRTTFTLRPDWQNQVALQKANPFKINNNPRKNISKAPPQYNESKELDFVFDMPHPLMSYKTITFSMEQLAVPKRWQ